MKEVDKTIKDVLTRVARMMYSDIRKNVPRKGTQPSYFKSTGDLKRSLRVSVDSRGDAIEVFFEPYGKYTAFGTNSKNGGGQYFDEQASRDTFFGMRAPRVYRKGTAAIRPQYWLSLSDQREKYEEFIEKNLQIGLDEFIENYLYDRI